MSGNPSPDLDLARDLLLRLHDATADPAGGVTREAYGAGEALAHAMAREAATAAGLQTRTDPAGNLYMTLPGRDRGAKRVVIGSHLDSVPRGGDYDGPAGVFGGLAIAAGLARAGFVPARDIEVMVIRAEEGGAWFPCGLPGSRAALGTLRPQDLLCRRMDGLCTLEEAMRDAGFDPDWVRAGGRELGPHNTAAYVELHIEQGPRLEDEGLPVGIVTSLPGKRRYRQGHIKGEYNHSGATPRGWRRDAAAALAELAARMDDYWEELETGRGLELVSTFCVMGTTAQAGFGVVPGESMFQLDIRSGSSEALELMAGELRRLAGAVEARRGVRIDLGPEEATPPIPMTESVITGLEAAARILAVPHRRMPSGGGHDAASFADAGIPTGMLFVRNQKGSHNPDEAMRMEDFAQASAVLMRWTLATSG
jgi:N-carbamoyl-L-amino-acid hydrolase